MQRFEDDREQIANERAWSERGARVEQECSVANPVFFSTRLALGSGRLLPGFAVAVGLVRSDTF